LDIEFDIELDVECDVEFDIKLNVKFHVEFDIEFDVELEYYPPLSLPPLKLQCNSSTVAAVRKTIGKAKAAKEGAAAAPTTAEAFV